MLAGKTAVVTGASRGIGRAVAIALANQGMNVALLARSVKDLEALETEINDSSSEGTARAFPVDMLDKDAVRAVIEDVATSFGSGGINVLVNNAGVASRAKSSEADLDVWDKLLDLNIKGVVWTTRFALPHMIEKAEAGERCAVINISSIAAKMSFAGSGAYCASKHAVSGYTGSLFEDVREHGIKVCAICPGFVNTVLVGGANADPSLMIQPDDIAQMVVFVATFPETGCPTEIVVRPQRTPYK